MEFLEGDTVQYSGDNKFVLEAQHKNGGTLTCTGTQLQWVCVAEETVMSYPPEDFTLVSRAPVKKPRPGIAERLARALGL